MNSRLFLLTAIAALTLITSSVFSQTKTEVLVTEIRNNGIKSKMERNASAFLTTINTAFQNQSVPVFDSKLMTPSAQAAVLTMWELSPFRCYETVIIEKGLNKAQGGFEVRNIPILMKNATKDSQYQEMVIVFNKTGLIENLYVSIGLNIYNTLINQGTDVTEIRRRQIILDFIENFKTAYNRKDLAYLKTVYSDDALIITGKVIKAKPLDTNNSMMGDEIISYQKLTKAQYIGGLEKAFKTNLYLNVKLENIEIKRHPKYAHIYGVSMDQAWNATNYKDQGYLFLLIDFSNDDNPIIHVRTWQPDKIGGGKLLETEKYKLEMFNVKS